MKRFGKPIKLFVISIVSIITVLILSQNIILTPYQLTIEIQSSNIGNLQVFYASVGGYSEENSTEVFIDSSNTIVEYTVTLSKNNINKIRIDPVGNFIIKSIELSNTTLSHKLEGQLLYDNFTPLHDIGNVSFMNNQIIATVNGPDPYFIINELTIVNKRYFALFFLVFAIMFSIYYSIWEYWLKFDFIKSSKAQQSFKISNSLFSSLIGIIFVWFLFQTVFYAINIDQGISPDENYHILLSTYQSESFGLHNQDSPRSYSLGAISVRPYLYHMLMGKSLMLNIWGLYDLYFLRLINVIFGMLTLYLTFLLVKEVSKNRFIQLAALIIQTNILMYVFLSSMVSYDNLVNLIAVGSFVALIMFLKNFSRIYLLLLILTMTLGALTKITYGPVIAIQFVILLYYSKSICRNRQKIFRKSFSFKEGALVVSVIILFGLNINLYVNNLITYGQIQPKTEKVFGHEKAYKYYSQYQRTINLGATLSDRPLMPLDIYLAKYLRRTGETIFGICGHNNLLRSNLILFTYGMLGLMSLLTYILSYKKLSNNLGLNIILFSFLSYALVILLNNYSYYLELGSFGLALQGRYNFPVIVLANIFIAYNLFAFIKDRTKITVLIIMTSFFVYNSFFWSISKFSSDWFLN